MVAVLTKKLDMTDEARETLIQDVGRLFIAAAKKAETTHSARDKAEARRLLDLQNAAIKERSEAQIARMEAERGLDEGADYFASMGAIHGQGIRVVREMVVA
jgi:hypothetical protein